MKNQHQQLVFSGFAYTPSGLTVTAKITITPAARDGGARVVSVITTDERAALSSAGIAAVLADIGETGIEYEGGEDLAGRIGEWVRQIESAA